MNDNYSVGFTDKLDYSQTLFRAIDLCNKLYVLNPTSSEFIRAVDILESIVPSSLSDKEYEDDLKAGEESSKFTGNSKEMLDKHKVTNIARSYFYKYRCLIRLIDRLNLLTFKLVDVEDEG